MKFTIRGVTKESSRTPRDALLERVSEKDFLQQIRDLARIFGWRDFHCFDSRRSPFGFPDCVLLRPPRLVFAELKSERGRVSEKQREWLNLLEQVPGIEVYVWTPKDWPEIEKVLR